MAVNVQLLKEKIFQVLVTWVIVNKRSSAYSVTWFNLKDTFLSWTPLLGFIVVTNALNSSYLTTFSYQSIMALKDLLYFSQDDIF